MEDGATIGKKGEERGRERAVRWPAGLGVAWICRGATMRERKGEGSRDGNSGSGTGYPPRWGRAWVSFFTRGYGAGRNFYPLLMSGMGRGF
jgi:hypothetical protein